MPRWAGCGPGGDLRHAQVFFPHFSLFAPLLAVVLWKAAKVPEVEHSDTLPKDLPSGLVVACLLCLEFFRWTFLF